MVDRVVEEGAGAVLGGWASRGLVVPEVVLSFRRRIYRKNRRVRDPGPEIYLAAAYLHKLTALGLAAAL